MKKKAVLLLYAVCCVALMAFLTGCPAPEPPAVNQVLSGTVRSLAGGAPVAEALVSAGGVSVETDMHGRFSLNVPGGVNGKIVSIKKPGFGLYSKPLESNHTMEFKLSAYLVPADFTMTIDPAQTNTLETDDGAKIEFPVLSGITENLEVTLVNYDVSGEELASVPGNFRGMKSTGETTNILSQGMLEVNVRGATSGDTYSFKDKGQSFTITIPATGDLTNPPATIPLWYYDETTGLWMEEGTPADKVIDPVTQQVFYVGTVTHFSVWNMDSFFSNPVTAHGTINDPDDDIYDMTMKGIGVNHPEFSTTDKDLTIINMAPDADMELTIVKRSTDQVYVINFTSPSTGTIELGNLFSDYYPFVRNLQYYHEGDTVYFSWQEPARADYTGLEIVYNHENGFSGSVMIPAGGTTQWALPGLAAGKITFTLIAYYSGGYTSPPIVRMTKIGSISKLTMAFGDNIIQDPYFTCYHLYYSYGNSTGFIEYTNPVLVPGYIPIRCKIVAVDVPDPYLKSYYWNRIYGSGTDGYYGDEYDFTNDDSDSDITVDFRNNET